MLKNIDKVLSPKLLKTLCEMGHGDELVIADGNFPSVSMNVNVIRADGLGVEELLRGIMKLFPLDRVVEKNVFLMDVPQGEEKPAIWNKYRSAIEESGEVYCEEYLERYALGTFFPAVGAGSSSGVQWLSMGALEWSDGSAGDRPLARAQCGER